MCICAKAHFSIPSPAAFTALSNKTLAEFYVVFIPNVYIVLQLAAARDLNLERFQAGGDDLPQILKVLRPYIEQGWTLGEKEGHFKIRSSANSCSQARGLQKVSDHHNIRSFVKMQFEQ